MLTNKVAIVTGATSGIGKAIALALIEAGTKVMINSSTTTESGEALAEAHPTMAYCQGDVSNEEDCQRLINSTIETWGALDILVNNAGISLRIPHHDLTASTDEIFNAMWQTNFMGTWYLCRAAMPYLSLSNDGNIINISSVAGTRATGSSIPYAVSKAAVNHLSILLANAFGDKVRVNAIAPGLILTPRTETWQDTIDYFSDKTAAHKAGDSDAIAQLALGMLKSNYLNGQVIECDGGFCLG